MTKQVSPVTHVSTCKSQSCLGLLLETKAWTTIIWMMVRGLMKLSLSSLGWLSPFNSPNHQLSALLFLVPLSILSRTVLLLLFALGCSSANNDVYFDLQWSVVFGTLHSLSQGVINCYYTQSLELKLKIVKQPPWPPWNSLESGSIHINNSIIIMII